MPHTNLGVCQVDGYGRVLRNHPFSAPRCLLVSPLHGIDGEDGVEAAEPDEERGGHAQLDDLRLGKVAPELGEHRVVDLVMVGRHQLGEGERGALTRAEEIRGEVVERCDLDFGQSSLPGPGIADRQSIVTRVPVSNLEPHELDQSRIEHALLG